MRVSLMAGDRRSPILSQTSSHKALTLHFSGGLNAHVDSS
jgi:hypothetical protein